MRLVARERLSQWSERTCGTGRLDGEWRDVILVEGRVGSLAGQPTMG